MNISLDTIEVLSRSIHGAWAKCPADSPVSPALYHAVCTINDILERYGPPPVKKTQESDYDRVIRDYGDMYQKVDNLESLLKTTVDHVIKLKNVSQNNSEDIADLKNILTATLMVIQGYGIRGSEAIKLPDRDIYLMDRSQELYNKLVGEEGL